MTAERNWAGNHTLVAQRVHRVTSIDEVRRLVATSPKIHAIGTRHSFNGAADSPGNLVDLGGLAPDCTIDGERMTVTVGGGTSYGTLATILHDQGFALHNLASLPHISVAGATATSTHGSGDTNGTLSSAVAALELVGSEGDLLTISRGDEGFDGMVVGLGAFGIVTRVTLDIQPTFDIRQDAFVDLPWTTLMSDFDAVSSAAYSVSVLTKWSAAIIDRLWLKTRVVDGAPPTVTAHHLGAVPGPVHALAVGTNDLLDALTPFGGRPGPWSERLAHFRTGSNAGGTDQIQSEYVVPREHAIRAFAALRGIGERIDPCLWITEIRTMAADDLWLSLSYGRDAVGIHFTWKKDHPVAVDRVTREIEALLIPLGARPHWGKVMHATAPVLAPLYPKFDDFRVLANHYDPHGKFRNEFLSKHVFS